MLCLKLLNKAFIFVGNLKIRSVVPLLVTWLIIHHGLREIGKKKKSPAPSGNQTQDLSILSPMCYHLRYCHCPNLGQISFNLISTRQRKKTWDNNFPFWFSDLGDWTVQIKDSSRRILARQVFNIFQVDPNLGEWQLFCAVGQKFVFFDGNCWAKIHTGFDLNFH